MNPYKLTAASLLASFSAFGVARADTVPVGTLVYRFTYSVTQDISSRDSTNPVEGIAHAVGTAPNGAWSNPSGGDAELVPKAGTGESSYSGALIERGTMTVNVMRKQPDGALDVMISEQGENIRRAPAAECVVYGNTHVMCDRNKTVYTEEYTLLRFLAANFVQLDYGKHWQIVEDVNNKHVTADYTIRNSNNGAVQIGEKRTIAETGSGRLTTDIEAKIGYDLTRAIPTSVDEYAQQYTDAGIKGSQRSVYQTTLQLVSDTMGKT